MCKPYRQHQARAKKKATQMEWDYVHILADLVFQQHEQGDPDDKGDTYNQPTKRRGRRSGFRVGEKPDATGEPEYFGHQPIADE